MERIARHLPKENVFCAAAARISPSYCLDPNHSFPLRLGPRRSPRAGLLVAAAGPRRDCPALNRPPKTARMPSPITIGTFGASGCSRMAPPQMRPSEALTGATRKAPALFSVILPLPNVRFGAGATLSLWRPNWPIIGEVPVNAPAAWPRSFGVVGNQASLVEFDRLAQ
jgi:hypothetical protein